MPVAIISPLHLNSTVLCPILVDTTKGIVALSGTSVGDTANFTCNPGFQLVGADTVTCEDNGEWSEEAPECRYNNK